MGVFQNNLMGAAAAAASAGGGDFYSQQIVNSIRADTNNGYLHRTPSSAGNRATWTFSTWIKLSQMGTGTRIIYSAGSSGDQDGYYRLFYNANKLIVSSANANFVTPSDTFRDPSSWYHIVWKQGSNATTLYVNGSQIATASVSGNTAVNNNTLQCIGTSSFGGSPTNSEHLDGYFAETIMIDGTALDADSFGETKNGVWIPKDASGLTFGTNGFHLKYESSSDLGNDSSGNNNDWTAVNLAAHDQMLDSPTFNSDSNGGNFATYNPLTKGSYTDLSEGNCRADSNTGADASYPSGNFAMLSGKWYYEQLIGNLTNSYPSPGLVACNNVGYDLTRGTFYAMRLRSDTGVAQQNSGDNIAPFGTITVNTTGVASVGTGDIVSWYVDMDNKKAWFAKNGSIPNSGDPANGTNPQFSWTENPPGGITFMSQEYQTSYTVVNAGQDGTFAGEKTAQGNSDDTGYGNFYYDPPTGFLALCSGNLPIADAVNPSETDDDYPQKLFNAIAYSGDGGGSFTTGFQPDLVWVKRRNGDQSNGLFDSSRGTSKVLNSDGEGEEATSSGLTSFDSTGYTMGNFYNQSGNTYVSWSWRANGGTTSTDSNGSVSSTVQADPSGSFSMVKFVGGIASAGTETVGHGLNKAPSLIMNFCYDDLDGGDGNRWVRSDGLTNWNYVLKLNGNAAPVDKSGNGNMSAPTSTVFSINNTDILGAGSQKIISYCFANSDWIKSGKYEGNGNADGTFVYTGFRPALVVNKRIDSTGHWLVHDDARDTYNPSKEILLWSGGDAEFNSANDRVDFLSNGFKMRSSNTGINGSGNDYIFLAMAHNPFKYATAR
jgi:hypothetical protein